MEHDRTLIIDRKTEKLREAILYFASHTNNCFKTKLIKLLYLFDFEHYRQTGRSVTGLQYYAWPKGPVPVELYEEFDNPSVIFGQDISLKHVLAGNVPGLLVESKRNPDLDIFSKRELDILEDLTKRYQSSTASEMIDVTHKENHAWDRTYRNGEGKNSLINYELAIDEKDWEIIKSMADDHEEFSGNFRL